MPPNVSKAPNRTRNPIDSMRSIARSRKLQTTGRMHRFGSCSNSPKAAGNLPASTMSTNDDGFPLHTEIRRGWRLEDRQNASDVEKRARRRTMTAFFTFFEFFETTGGLDPYLAYAKSKAHIRLRRNRRVHYQLRFFQCAGALTWSNAFAVTDFNFPR